MALCRRMHLLQHERGNERESDDGRNRDSNDEWPTLIRIRTNEQYQSCSAGAERERDAANP